MVERTRRPRGGYLQGMDGVECAMPGWAADWLLRQTNLAQRRVALRGVDLLIDDWLAEVTYTANAWRTSVAPSVPGSSLVDVPVVVRSSDAHGLLGARQAAEVIGIEDRSVRLACAEGRLKASKVDGRWLIAVDDARAFRDRSDAA